MLKVGDKVRIVGYGFKYGSKCDVIGRVEPHQGANGGQEDLYAQLTQRSYWVTDDPNSLFFNRWGVEFMEDSAKAHNTESMVGRFSVGDKVIIKPEINPVWGKFGIGEVVKIENDGATLDVAFRGVAVRETFSADYVRGRFNAKNIWKLV